MRAQGVNPPMERSAWIPLASAKGRWIIVVTALGSGMVFLDGTVVNVALPRMQTDLGIPLSGLQWIIDAYVLFLAALLLVGGSLGDVYGRRRGFVAGLLVFTVSSAACGFAPNGTGLIAARAAQGIGGALLVPGSLAMIKATILPEDSGKAIGLWAGLSGVTTALGPLLGGYLVTAVSWRLIFFINIPLAVITLLAAIAHVPETHDPNASKHLDWMGAAATVVGLGGLTFGLIQGPEIGWTNALVLLSLVVGAIALLLFPFVEESVRNPMVPLHLFRSSNFTGSNLATLGVYFAFNGGFLFIVLKLQQVQGYSPLEAGSALIPLTVLLLVLSPRVGGLIPRFGARLLMTSGAGVLTLAFALFAAMGRSPSYWIFILPTIIVMGLGMCLFITPLTATVMAAVPADLVGVASGVNNAVSRVAALLAIALLGVVVVGEFESSLGDRLHSAGIQPGPRAALLAHASRLADDPIPRGLTPAERARAHAALLDAYVSGYRWAMGSCAILCALSAIVSGLTIRPEAFTAPESAEPAHPA